MLWLALLLVVYVAANDWLDLAAARHNTNLMHFHVLDTVIRMISGRIKWDEGRLCASVPLTTLAVFAASETPVHDQVMYQVSTEHGCLLAGWPDFGTRPAFDVAGLADAGIYTDTVEGQPVHMATVARTMYDAGHTGRVVTRVMQTMDGHDVAIHQLWWPTTVHQLALVGLVLAMILIGPTLELRPVLRLVDNVSARAFTDLAPFNPDGLQHELQPIVGAPNQYLQRIANSALTQKRFIADATHQMYTPLAILDAQMQAAAQTSADAALHETLRAMCTNARNLTDLINDLLLLFQAKSPAATSGAVGLSQVAHTVLEGLALLANGRRIDLGIELVDLPMQTLGNRTLIAALLFNLVDNVVRYTRENGHATVQASADHGWAMLTVTDNGPDAPSKAYTRVFERLTCLDDIQTQGTGLGLMIVRQIVDRMGDQIAPAPGPGGIGLAVTVWLRRTSASIAG